jgi:hypothetical protein
MRANHCGHLSLALTYGQSLPFSLFACRGLPVALAPCGAVWPYAVIDDVTKLGGAVLRCIFFLVLTSLFVALGVGGVALLQLRAA